MIVALLALAAAMMIAGVTAVVEGFPYVRLESGMAMVYGGAVVGSSGALLLGFAAVVSALRRVERAVGIARPSLNDDGPVAVGPLSNAAPMRDPIADELRLMEASAVEPSPVDRPRIEPPLVAPAQITPTAVTPPAREAQPVAPTPSDLELLGLSAPEPAEVRPASRKAPQVNVRPPTITTKPAPVEEIRTDGKAPAADPFDELVAPDKPERTPVGRYSSEGNTYVMFDDGSIEADTPKGRYTFASLDELKAFVDNGGERGARGAA
ncbi:hypothetical protein [Methylobacterium aerolatum]|uniref:Uncharacterized protein n=1 Tax=Methylobacterium aerolatum TaxID=418708 RepID=A0ABU0I1L7_9HYPH|nr:hypothetical protein [Methylobacterium aerolatum]MDQ0448491.1 hypothetical protein [Methylobacterium aerolatum]GJD34572.1 hypothetical protein FMGBMHLM_1474 [Methylobacterium aerolatum]